MTTTALVAGDVVGFRAQPAAPSWLAARLTPGWPLAVLFLGYPVWWMLGLSQLMSLVVAGVLALELARHRSVVVPAGFGIWVLFLLCTLTGPVVAQVVAPGTEPAVELTHYFTWAYRMSFLVVATVAVAYICTFRLSARRLGRLLSVMFLVVVGGGLLGVVAPHLSFPSVVEVLLPQRYDANPFLHAQVHPTPAELQDYLGRRNARPSAPFSYANEWGLNYALLLPFFIGTWLARDAGWRRVVAPAVLLVSLVPVVYSLNRGLWAALAISVAFVALRSAAAGHLRALVGAAVLAVLIPVVVVASPLGAKIEARLSGHNSNEGRTHLATLAVVSTATRSPIVGYGATRRVQGTFHSIAEGATVQCPRCTPPALGTQGQIWTVTFSFGLVALTLFVGFFAWTFLRHLRRRRASDTMALTVLLVYLVTLPVYDFSYPALIAVMSAVALLARPWESPRPPTLGALTAFVRAHRGVLTACVALGVLAGATSQVVARPVFHATTSLQVPLGGIPGQPDAQPLTLDDLAQVVHGGGVRATIADDLGVTPADVDDALAVTATPNTRILHLTYTAASAAQARHGADAAAAALLAEQDTALGAQRDQVVRSLSQRSDQLDRALRTLREGGPIAGSLVAAALQDSLSKEHGQVQQHLISAQTARLDPGSVLTTTRTWQDRDGWWIWLPSGAVLGLLAGVGLARWCSPRLVRVGRAVRGGEVEGTRVLLAVDDVADLNGRGTDALRRAVARQRPAAFLALDPDPGVARVARVLEDDVLGADDVPAGAVVLVVPARARLARLRHRLRQLDAASVAVTGVVLVRASRRSPLDPITPTRLRPAGAALAQQKR